MVLETAWLVKNTGHFRAAFLPVVLTKHASSGTGGFIYFFFKIFLMWAIFKVFIKFVILFLLFSLLVFGPQGMWDLISMKRA